MNKKAKLIDKKIKLLSKKSKIIDHQTKKVDQTITILDIRARAIDQKIQALNASKQKKQLKTKNASNTKKCIFIDKTVRIGKNVQIYPNNTILGYTIIEDGCILLPNNIVKDSVIGAGTTLESSNVAEAKVGKGTVVGPFARLRPKAVVGDHCKIGNFVEIKNATLGNGSKASHLAYIGDADIGEDCNIGCGVIFVNYNGKEKFRTKVGNKCFIGSNCNVVAPVNIANGSYICAGTTLTVNTAENDFVIGRSRETIKAGMAIKYQK